ncbi:hypothetical protein BDSB_24375 [Burkholderia dolosa PC543]|nr:hypothetical protein BDSB_24375 [Burkholderia dolosa PC543]
MPCDRARAIAVQPHAGAAARMRATRRAANAGERIFLS